MQTKEEDRKKIDFNLRLKDILIPIVVKLNYEQFSPTAIRYFTTRYDIENNRVVGLNGMQKDKSCVYPWDA